MDSDTNERHRRGRYCTKQRVPRQTIHSRKKKLSRVTPSSTDNVHEATATTITAELANVSNDPESTSCGDATCVESCYERAMDLTSDADMNYPTDSVSLVDPPPISHQLINISDTENISSREATSKLYDGSSISTETSHLLISSYMCRHHLTGQAREDLLKLLQFHLPKENQLPPSLFTFNRKADHSSNITPDYHYYCSECYTLLPSENDILCPNKSCNTTINKESSKCFITVSIAEQLKILLSSK